MHLLQVSAKQLSLNLKTLEGVQHCDPSQESPCLQYTSACSSDPSGRITSRCGKLSRKDPETKESEFLEWSVKRTSDSTEWSEMATWKRASACMLLQWITSITQTVRLFPRRLTWTTDFKQQARFMKIPQTQSWRFPCHFSFGQGRWSFLIGWTGIISPVASVKRCQATYFNWRLWSLRSFKPWTLSSDVGSMMIASLLSWGCKGLRMHRRRQCESNFWQGICTCTWT